MQLSADATRDGGVVIYGDIQSKRHVLLFRHLNLLVVGTSITRQCYGERHAHVANIPDEMHGIQMEFECVVRSLLQHPMPQLPQLHVNRPSRSPEFTEAQSLRDPVALRCSC